MEKMKKEAPSPIPEDPEDSAVPISPERQKSPGDAETAEVVKSPPSEEPPTPAKEGPGEEATIGEKPELTAEEPPAVAEADKEALAKEHPEHPTSSEDLGEAEAAKDVEDSTAPSAIPSLEKLTEVSRAQRVPSQVTLLGELPTSASFSEGELLEPPPLQVGVELGGRISQSLWVLEQRHLSSRSLVVGGSPESEAGEEGQETEEQIEQRAAEEHRRRIELMEQYRQLLAERGRLRHYNTKLQSKLAELLNKAKGKERVREELVQHVSDREQRYGRYLAMLEELRNQQAEEMAWYQKEIDALQRSCSQKLAKVDSEWKTYQAVKKEVAVYTMGRRLGGKQAAIREVDKIQAKEQNKEREMTEVRLENIKFKHRIQKLDASLKAQEELAEGLHLIDFEQLKIENQTYNEKIEERNEELLKLRRKVTNTVQILSQVKEKLQFVEAENQGQKAKLMAVEGLVAQNRDILTRTKQVRDKLRIDNQRLQQKCGLLGNTLLLRDFEEKVDAAEIMKERLETLKRHYAGLSLTCNGIKKKIKGAKSFLPF
ncbi:coiled-coil domain-containing protein 96 [Python bivittatus]|uniref:Coiled-coil domain-containing protein 96 n=1 Tax=Python bivittatus TaxID=176946 RepID=A0A9F2N9K6_PYTBI|nr:coiled-coil domain-containing protein 96 [Python bivittatus]